MIQSETPQEMRVWENLQNILTATELNKEIVGKMIKDRKYITMGFLALLEDNAKSVINIVAVMRIRKSSRKEG